MRRFVALCLLALPTVALAQERRFELTGSLGLATGGSIFVSDAFVTRNIDTEVDIISNASLGLKFDWTITPNLQIEFLTVKEQTQFEDESRLFGEIPGGDFPERAESLLDVDVDYYHAGVLWQWQRGRNNPFVVGSAGVTRIGAENLPLPADTRPSVSAGGGIKLAISERFAVRFEGRAFYTDTDENESATVRTEVRDCVDPPGPAPGQPGVPFEPCFRTYRYDDSLLQLEGSVGFTYKF
jgi:hypothetical protein